MKPTIFSNYKSLGCPFFFRDIIKILTKYVQNIKISIISLPTRNRSAPPTPQNDPSSQCTLMVSVNILQLTESNVGQA